MIKAEIIEQMVSHAGTRAISGRGKFPIQRIFIPCASNLVITPYKNNLYIWDNFQKTPDCKTLKEIEIADELVETACSFLESKESLLEQFQRFLKD